MGLKAYREKRDFAETPEPAGDTGVANTTGTRVYVVQKHAASRLHYDVRLQLDGVLKSWAVPKGPSLRAGVRRLAIQTEDHPLAYGQFEGRIPEGQYGGGVVMLWDRGTWEPTGDPLAGYREGRLTFRLTGEKLGGSWTLVRIEGDAGPRSEWLLLKSRDDHARGEADPTIVEELPRSVLTGRDLREIGRGAPDGDRGARTSPGSRPVDPATVEGAEPAEWPASPGLQLAERVASAPEGDGWLHEIKLDGYRMLSRIRDGEVRITSRRGVDWTDRFPRIAHELTELPVESAILDGEVVILDDGGLTSFQALQNSLSDGGPGARLLYLFDLSYLDGHDLRGVALEQRKRLLEPLLARADHGVLRYSDHVRGRGPEVFRAACDRGAEGIIAKRADAPYREGRGRGWLKVKCVENQEFLVVGFTPPGGTRQGFGALLLGVYDDGGGLTYVGRVGTGFDSRTLVDLRRRLGDLERETSPLDLRPNGRVAREARWVEPRLVVQVEFAEWTDAGRLRHPSFKGIRMDTRPEGVTRENVREEAGQEQVVSEGGEGERPDPASVHSLQAVTDALSPADGSSLRVAGVEVTNPDKVLWEGQGVTKRHLVAYYTAVEKVVLPRMADRPLMLLRCPSGAEESCFHQKNVRDGTPESVGRVEVGGDEADESVYMYVKDLEGLLSLVQLGTLEFHVWGARRDRLDRPDRVVLDLDPDEGLPFGRVRDAALRVRDMLAAIGLRSWPRSTGGKGLHVVVPLVRRNGWEDVKRFAQGVATRLEDEDPAGFTASLSKKRRKGRIFVDYLRNAANATAIADYSTRARPGAPVAAPVSWQEVTDAGDEALRFGMNEVLRRVALHGDPWTGFDEVRQSLTKARLREMVQAGH